MNIKELITENTNIIEIYLLNKNKRNDYDIYIDDVTMSNIKKKFKLTRETTLVYFNRKNLTYVYDLSNDSQYVFLRKLEHYKKSNLIFAVSFNEMKLQTHSFACTDDIDTRTEYKLQEYKINNRISLIIKNNNILITYKHSKEVDLEKINEIVNNIIRKIKN
jgi:hypothetical protein